MRAWLVSACCIGLVAAGLPGPLAADPDAAHQRELRSLLRQDCGSCHGMTLRGGLGPPLLPQALAGKAEDQLVATVLNGRAGTAMPPWRPFLNEDEARWLVRLLQRGDSGG